MLKMVGFTSLLSLSIISAHVLGGKPTTYTQVFVSGKCANQDGGDPPHTYYDGKSQSECEEKCNSDDLCTGYSVSKYNCLNWKDLLSERTSQENPWWNGCWIREKQLVDIRGPYVKANSCPNGHADITKQDDCEKAAKAFGYRYRVITMVRPDFPKYCIVDKSDFFYFNTANSTVRNSADYQLICKTAPATTRAPAPIATTRSCLSHQWELRFNELQADEPGAILDSSCSPNNLSLSQNECTVRCAPTHTTYLEGSLKCDNYSGIVEIYRPAICKAKAPKKLLLGLSKSQLLMAAGGVAVGVVIITAVSYFVLRSDPKSAGKEQSRVERRAGNKSTKEKVKFVESTIKNLDKQEAKPTVLCILDKVSSGGSHQEVLKCDENKDKIYLIAGSIAFTVLLIVVLLSYYCCCRKNATPRSGAKE